MKVGVVALSFAKRALEPNPVNVRLAQVVDELDEEIERAGDFAFVVAQWEVALALPFEPDLTVHQTDATNVDRNGKPYLDSQDVLRKAFEAFRAEGIDSVIVVANPFVHLPAVQAIVKREGFNLLRYHIPWVGFDNSRLNLQWWCKNPFGFIAYLGLQIAGKLLGKNFHGIGEKPHPH